MVGSLSGNQASQTVGGHGVASEAVRTMTNPATQDTHSTDWAATMPAVTIDGWYSNRPARTSGGVARSGFAKRVVFKMMEFRKVSFEIGEPFLFGPRLKLSECEYNFYILFCTFCQKWSCSTFRTPQSMKMAHAFFPSEKPPLIGHPQSVLQPRERHKTRSRR